MDQTSTGDNAQFGITSPDGGAPDPDTTYGKGRKPMVDGAGRLAVRLADSVGFLDGNYTSRSQTGLTGLVEQLQVAGGPSQLVHLSGYKATAPARFVQLFDTLAVLVGGEVPAVALPLTGGLDQLFSLDVPWRFSVGIRIALSTTGLTYTPGGIFLAFQAITLQ